MQLLFTKKMQASITTKLVLLILGFSLLATLLATGIHVFVESKNREAMVAKRLEQIGDSNLRAIAATMWDVDENRLQILLKGILGLPDMEMVKVLDASAEIAVVGDVRSKFTMEKQFPIEFVDQVKGKKENGEFEVNRLGTLVVVAGLDSIRNGLWQLFVSILLYQGIQIFCVCTFLLMLFEVLVTKHLRKIYRFTSTLSVEKLVDKLRLDRSEVVQDELSQVVVSLNMMNEKLYQYTTNLQELIEEKTKDISCILDTIEQGIFTFSSGLKINDEYSRHLQEIFATKKIAGRDVLELLFSKSNLSSETLSQVLSALVASIGEESFAFDMNSDCLVREIEKTMPDGRIKTLELDWTPILNEDEITDKIMVTVRDVTEMRSLQRVADEKKREIEMIVEIISISTEKFREFANNGRDFIVQNRRIIEENQQGEKTFYLIILRNLHTFKGTARTLGLVKLSSLIHDVEDTYLMLQKLDANKVSTHILLDPLNEINIKIEEYIEINDKKLGRADHHARDLAYHRENVLEVLDEQVQTAIELLHEIDPSRLGREAQEKISEVQFHLQSIGTNSLSYILSTLLGSIPHLARDLGKETPSVTILEQGILLRPAVQSILKDIFTHLVRNSLDHGIEMPKERIVKGKEAQGLIEMHLFVQDQQLRITYRDDGRGLDLGKIKSKAQEKGLWKAEWNVRPPSMEKIFMLIFEVGLTTVDKITEFSGRGVGLDVVKKNILQLGGDLVVRPLGASSKEKEKDKVREFYPFEFIITLPEKTFVMDPKMKRKYAA